MVAARDSNECSFNTGGFWDFLEKQKIKGPRSLFINNGLSHINRF
jgi:hypothetical protein